MKLRHLEPPGDFPRLAMAALKPFGIQTPATLTAFILQLVPTDGMQVGDYYEVDYQKVTLRIQVFQDAIEVDHTGELMFGAQ